MNNRYYNEILSYLEQKYNLLFHIEKILSKIEPSGEFVVLAQCHSDRYPLASFDVIYHLSLDDVGDRSVLVDSLKKSGLHIDEDSIEASISGKAYFEDNYLSVIMQHKFDDLYNTDDIKIFSKFTSLSFFEETTSDLWEYIEKSGDKIISENYIFVPRDSEFSESEYVSSMVNECIRKQFVCVVYINGDTDDWEKLFYENYEFPYEAIKKSSMTDALNCLVYSFGRSVS